MNEAHRAWGNRRGKLKATRTAVLDRCSNGAVTSCSRVENTSLPTHCEVGRNSSGGKSSSFREPRAKRSRAGPPKRGDVRARRRAAMCTKARHFSASLQMAPARGRRQFCRNATLILKHLHCHQSGHVKDNTNLSPGTGRHSSPSTSQPSLPSLRLAARGPGPGVRGP